MITDAELTTLQDIVGPAHVERDPCVMDTYAFYMNPEALNKEGGRFTPRPAAVVMPASTAEVQEIVRFCNTTDLMVKPFSTGFCVMGSPSRQRVLTLDLKRMNRIIDIDYQNQIAIVEPYVRAIDLQTRIMKHGLNCHVVSAGGHHSVLASTTSAWGTGVNGPSMGYAARNMLGAEWVLPTGEVLTLGSGGNGAGWFSPDGPGPATRGIFRGFQGAFGGLGVVTKCAIKLYRWDGPEAFEVGGKSPDYAVTALPENIALNPVLFPSLEAMREAGYKLGDADIEYANFRTPMFFMALGMTRNNRQLKHFLEAGIFQKIARYGLVNAIVGYSAGEFQWKMKVFWQVMKETGGVVLPPASLPATRVIQRMGRLTRPIKDPLWILRRLPRLQRTLIALSNKLPFDQKGKMETLSRMVWVLLRHGNNVQGTLRASQALATTLGSLDTWDVGINQMDWIAREKQDAIRRGVIVDDDGDLGCGGTFEAGHMGYLEGIILYSTKNPESCRTTDKLIEGGAEASIKHHFGIPIAGFGAEANARLGPHCGNYHQWMDRIKLALDPNYAADPFFYADPRAADTSDPAS